MSVVQIQTVSHRHEHIIDFLLAHPEVKNLQILCDRLQVSRSWLSVVMNSDAFRAAYQQRRDDYNERLGDSVQTKLYEAAGKALDKMINALDDDEIDPRFALDAMDKTTHKLGLGPKAGNAPAVLINDNRTQVVDASLLKEVRQDMRQVSDGTTDSLPQGNRVGEVLEHQPALLEENAPEGEEGTG